MIELGDESSADADSQDLDGEDDEEEDEEEDDEAQEEEGSRTPQANPQAGGSAQAEQQEPQTITSTSNTARPGLLRRMSSATQQRVSVSSHCALWLISSLFAAVQ